jgi:DNA-binding SARP family transcriptional activator
MKNTLILLFLFCVQIIFSQDYLDNGLFFSSHEVNQDQRTSLDLTPGKPLYLKKGFSLEFEANFRYRDKHLYGNIFKIIGDDNLNIDFAARTEKSNLISNNFWIVVKDTMLFKYNWSDIPRGDYDKWIHFKLEINVEASSITCTINGHKIVKKTKDIKGIENWEIIFGKSKYTDFSTTDVCPMSVKNIKLFDQNNTLIRHWPLGKHTANNKIYDNLTNDEAIVENAKWLIDQHVFWQKNKDFEFDNLLGTAKDEEGERIFFIDSKAVYVYSIPDERIDTLNYTQNQLRCESTEFIYNKFKDELIAYSIDEQTYNNFDFKNLKWHNQENECQQTYYLHHNKMISPIDSTLVTFGGYGYYNYKSVIKNYIPNSQKLLNFDISNQISPRYLSSSGILNENSFLVFGGYGSSSGDQNINPRFYYDLYSLAFENSESRTVKKLWEFKNSDQAPFVPVQSMVIDHNSDSFYTLTYNNTEYKTHLKLAQFGIKEQKMVVFPDSIPYKFLDIKSNADFFLDKNKSKLYTMTIKDDKVNLFSLTYPPLLAEDIYQEEIIQPVIPSSLLLFILVVIVIVLIVFVVLRKRSSKHSIEVEVEVEVINEEIQNISHSTTEKIKKSAIYLFGGFQVYDNEGNDITNLFTPTLKQLFISILLYGVKNDKGISSNKLTELLWPNKTENKARNNRNTNISKLRFLLEKIGNLKLNNENTYWRINIENTVFCDYYFINNLLKQSTNNNLEELQIYELLNIVRNGEIMPDIHTDWIEDFRNNIANLLIDDLSRISKSQDNLQMLGIIGSTILKYAPLNEYAISLKCKSLYALGKKGTAKNIYNSFCKKYHELLDAKYDKTFKEIIS